MKSLSALNLDTREQIRDRIGLWKSAFGLDPDAAFFASSESIPRLDWRPGELSLPTAWWLGELCRLAYTPDHREIERRRSRKLPVRREILAERSPFTEIYSLHKTGNHASIYRRRDDTGPTILCFRGTNRTRQWIMNAVIRPHRWQRFRLEGDLDTIYVHSGFYVFLKRVWPILEETLADLPRPWIFTGHSLGGALANLAGALARPDLLCTFGAPMVGNGDFYLLENAPDQWRFVNTNDIVPLLPLRDERLGERQFTHGRHALHLLDGGKIETGRSDLDVFEILKDPSTNHRKPPGWLVDHRIGEYCDKIRAALESKKVD